MIKQNKKYEDGKKVEGQRSQTGMKRKYGVGGWEECIFSNSLIHKNVYKIVKGIVFLLYYKTQPQQQ